MPSEVVWREKLSLHQFALRALNAHLPEHQRWRRGSRARTTDAPCSARAPPSAPRSDRGARSPPSAHATPSGMLCGHHRGRTSRRKLLASRIKQPRHQQLRVLLRVVARQRAQLPTRPRRRCSVLGTFARYGQASARRAARRYSAFWRHLQAASCSAFTGASRGPRSLRASSCHRHAPSGSRVAMHRLARRQRS